MTLRNMILPILIMLSTSIHASSLTLEDPVADLDPSIQSVSLCGDWHHLGERGSFRVIHGWLWGHTEIYIQWLADPVWYPERGKEKRETPLVVYTLSIPEYDHYEAATNLADIRCTKKNGKWSIVANADNANDDEATGRYQLIIFLDDQPGHFTITKQILRRGRNWSTQGKH